VVFVVAATWRARPGQGERLARIAERMVKPSRAEPGCRGYWAHRAVDDPDHLFLYEVYDDRAALDEHTRSEHFKRLVLGEAAGLLEDRSREYFQRLEDA
jgi:quinol monooxygenase YgiN